MKKIKFHSNNNLLVIRIYKGSKINTNTMENVINDAVEYISNSKLQTTKKIIYGNCKEIIIRSFFAIDKQWFDIKSDDKIFLTKFNNILGDFNTSFGLETIIENTLYNPKICNDALKISINRKVLEEYKRLYFISDKKFVDVIIAIEPQRIIDEIIEIIKNVYGKDEGKVYVIDMPDSENTSI